jgi:CubicO group peptidase (beta-lactamase class C family)
MPLAKDAIFKIASCTKLITTIATLQCVERGLIALDDSVYKVLPELAGSQIISSNDDNKPFQYAKPKRDITVRHLLTHSSGIAYDAMLPILAAWRASRGEGLKTFNGTVPDAFTLPLIFEPGEGWVYGGNLDWAGYIVRRLNGNISLGQYFEENIWKRLGIAEPYPTFDLNKHPDLKARLMETAERQPDGSLEPSVTPFAESPVDELGGAGLALSLSQYTAVLADIISDSPKLLKPESITAMFTPQFLPGSPSHVGLLGGKEVFGAMTGGAPTDDTVNHGLGGLIIASGVEELGIPKFTLAWGGIPNLVWMANRAKGIAMLYGTQVLPPGDGKSAELLTAFLSDFWGQVKG